MNQIKDLVAESFLQHFPKEVLDWSKPRKQFSSWSSLKHVEFLFFLEGKFQVRFTPEDILEAQNLEAISELISKKQGLKP